MECIVEDHVIRTGESVPVGNEMMSEREGGDKGEGEGIKGGVRKN